MHKAVPKFNYANHSEKCDLQRNKEKQKIGFNEPLVYNREHFTSTLDQLFVTLFYQNGEASQTLCLK